MHRYILIAKSFALFLQSWVGKLITGSLPNENLKTKMVQPFQFNASISRNPFPTDIEALKKSIQEFEASK